MLIPTLIEAFKKTAVAPNADAIAKHVKTLFENAHINPTYHIALPLVALNYTADTPKEDAFGMECRGLVLDANNWRLVARAFSRFFNWGEIKTGQDQFDWSNCMAQSKEDGSLILIYYYNNDWIVGTRGGFGDNTTPGNLRIQVRTFRDVVMNDVIQQNRYRLLDKLDKTKTYVFELVGPYTKIIRRYKITGMYFLSVFDGEKELPYKEIERIHKDWKHPLIWLPETFDFHNITEVIDFLYMRGRQDPTFEGVVLRDSANRRWKVKNPEYLQIKEIGNAGGVLSAKHLVSIVLHGDPDEFVTYYPEYKEDMDEVKQQIDDLKTSLRMLWGDTRRIDSQKDFALAIVGKHPLYNLLFMARKTGDFDSIWKHQNTERQVLRVLKKG